MPTYSKGEIVLVLFPYSSRTGGRVRPALVLLDDGDQDVLAARITSTAFASSHDLTIADWQSAGLRGLATVRMHKISTIDKNKKETWSPVQTGLPKSLRFTSTKF